MLDRYVEKVNTPILSICIPTYNRAPYLRESLQSIVIQDVFFISNNIEIIVSDNCSSDDTTLVVHEFIQRFPTKIVYHRNERNIEDLNFIKVLTLARGTFLKLSNDTVLFDEFSLSYMVEEILKSKKNSIIIFTNRKDLLTFSNPISDVNSFLKYISYWSTWILHLGFFKEHLDFVSKVFYENYKSKLAQVNIYFELLLLGNVLRVLGYEKIWSVQSVKKQSYDLAQIFVLNYYQILSYYVKFNHLDSKIVRSEMRKVIFIFLYNASRSDIWQKKSIIFTFSLHFKIIKYLLLNDFRAITNYSVYLKADFKRLL